MIFSGHYYQEGIQKCPEKIAKSFRGYSFIIFNTLLSPKRRNPFSFENGRNPPSNRQGDERAGEILARTVASNAAQGRRCRRRICTCLVLLRKYSFYPIILRRNILRFNVKSNCEDIKKCNKARQMPSVTIGEACPLVEPCASKAELA